MMLLYGQSPNWVDGYGYGSGYGYGYGSGYGDGYGYGDGSGYGSGYGDGYGYGSGYGDGYGYGDGDGSGDGSGYGYGYGYGYGDGSGDGSGYGYGYGSGYGDGYGSGYGYGYGDGDGYWFSRFAEFEALPRVQELIDDPNVVFAYWRSDKNGKPDNGGKSTEAARAGLVQEIAGPLELCTPRALHATVKPEKWRGERLWLVALFGETQWCGDKVGALKREILAEVVVYDAST